MKIPAVQPLKINPDELPLDKLAANTKIAQAQKIQAVSQKFEAVLLRQILEETQQPVFTSSLVGNSATDGIYRDLVISQLADSISKSGKFGLAKSLAKELEQRTQKHAHSTPNSDHLKPIPQTLTAPNFLKPKP